LAAETPASTKGRVALIADVDYAGKSRFPQPLLEDRGTDRAFVDNDDFGRRLGAHRSFVFRQNISYHAAGPLKAL
jgi:hypothetical protein